MKKTIIATIVIDTEKRDKWFDNLSVRHLVSTEEFFYVWDDYKCTCTAGFALVCNDLWYNGVSEDFRDEFYLKYRDEFDNN